MTLDLKDSIDKETTVQKEKVKETPKQEPKKNNSVADNIVFVGSKPISNYVKSVIFQFKKKNSNSVTIKSRGKFISKAVDVAEIARRKYLQNDGIRATDIKIESETFQKDDKTINVSTIEITLSK